VSDRSISFEYSAYGLGQVHSHAEKNGALYRVDIHYPRCITLIFPLMRLDLLGRHVAARRIEATHIHKGTYVTNMDESWGSEGRESVKGEKGIFTCSYFLDLFVVRMLLEYYMSSTSMFDCMHVCIYLSVSIVVCMYCVCMYLFHVISETYRTYESVCAFGGTRHSIETYSIAHVQRYVKMHLVNGREQCTLWYCPHAASLRLALPGKHVPRLHGVCTQRIERKWTAHSHSIDVARIRHVSRPLETRRRRVGFFFVRNQRRRESVL